MVEPSWRPTRDLPASLAREIYPRASPAKPAAETGGATQYTPNNINGSSHV